MTAHDLEEQTGLSHQTVQELLDDQTGTLQAWNDILTWFNDLPAICYPAESILQEIREDMDRCGSDAPCEVYYGVNAKDLIFCGLRNLADMQYHGAQVDTSRLAVLHIPLQEALTLFSKQNCTE